MEIIPNIKFFLDPNKADKLIKKADKLLQEPKGENRAKIQKIVSQLEGWNKSFFNKAERGLDGDLVRIEFTAKKLDSDYTLLSGIAAKTYKQSTKIVDGAQVKESDILSHPEEFHFLVNEKQNIYGEPTTFYRQIKTHDKNWNDTAQKISKKGEKIAFGDGKTVNEVKKEINEENKTKIVTRDGVVDLIVRDGQGKIQLKPSYQRELGVATYSNSISKTEKELYTYEKGRYYVSLVSSMPGKSDKKHIGPVGWHTWLRLTGPNGEVYSVGKWPNETPVLLAANMAPLFQGHELHELDKKKDIYEKTIEITEEQYNKLFERIQSDLNSEEGTENDYNALKNNCADWAIDLLMDKGIIEEMTEKNRAAESEKGGEKNKPENAIKRDKVKVNLYRALLPSRVNFALDALNERKELTPLKIFLAIFSLPILVILSPLARTFILLLGATVKGKSDKVDALINDITDLFSRNLLRVTHPYYLQRYAKQNFDAMSKARAEELKLQDIERKKVIKYKNLVKPGAPCDEKLIEESA